MGFCLKEEDEHSDCQTHDLSFFRLLVFFTPILVELSIPIQIMINVYRLQHRFYTETNWFVYKLRSHVAP